jgi:polyphosphate glucokinase
MQILGVDIGGSGLKGAIVDVISGELRSERIRLVTPKPSTPERMAETFLELVQKLNWSGPVGCGFPAIVRRGIAETASNIDKSWIGKNIETLFSEATGLQVAAVNDADAAGYAEMDFGQGKNQSGTVLLITIGSGIGTALFIDGKEVPNTEFGHLFMHNMIAEHYVSNSARKKHDLSWEKWGKRFNEYLHHLERLLSPDLFILGGGISKDFNNYAKYFNITTTVTPARLLNNAGIVGAAGYAFRQISHV